MDPFIIIILSSNSEQKSLKVKLKCKYKRNGKNVKLVELNTMIASALLNAQTLKMI